MTSYSRNKITTRENDATPPHSTPSTTKINSGDDIRAGYEAAVQMAVYDGQLSWQVTGSFVQFAIIIIAGSVFPSFIGSEESLIVAIAGLAASLAGIIMTSMFGSTVLRIRTHEEYWVRCAKQLESLMSDQVKTFEGSSTLSSQGCISFNGDRIEMRKIATIRSKVMLGTLYLCFLLIFLSLFGLNVWRFVSVI